MKISRRARLWWLAGLLVSSEVLYLAMLRLDAINGVRPVLAFLGLLGALFTLYAIAYWIVKGRGENHRNTLLIIAAGAVLFRLTLLPAGLPHDASWDSKVADLRADLRGESVTYERFQLFDGDIWRYLWDGHVSAHGTNPYLHAPTDPALDKPADEENAALTDGRALWSDIRDNINYALTPTIYPPLAQVVFQVSHILAPGSVLVMKGLLVGFDLLATLFIALTLKALWPAGGRGSPLCLESAHHQGLRRQWPRGCSGRRDAGGHNLLSRATCENDGCLEFRAGDSR